MNTSLHHRLVWRALGREPGRALLVALAVALGVAVYLSIRLADRAAVASFEGFTRGIGTGADLIVRAEVGPMQESGLFQLDALRRDAWIRPVLEGSFTSASGLETFQVLGTDLVVLGTGLVGPGTDLVGLGDVSARVLEDPDAVLVSPALARSVRVGDPLPGLVDGRVVRLRVAGILPDDPGRPPVQRNLLVMDLPAAQRLFRRPGQLDRLDLGWLPGRDGAAVQARAAAALPPGWILEAPEQRAASARAMSAAFRLNLTVLSLVALAVGAYLLFQGFDAAVNRRRETWALLQALGCPGRRILALVLLEAALLGALGSLLGLALGWAMAQGAVRLVARTMAALYGAASAREAAFQGREAAARLGCRHPHLPGGGLAAGATRRGHPAGAAPGPGGRGPAHALGARGPGRPAAAGRRDGPGVPARPARRNPLARLCRRRPGALRRQPGHAGAAAAAGGARADAPGALGPAPLPAPAVPPHRAPRLRRRGPVRGGGHDGGHGRDGAQLRRPPCAAGSAIRCGPTSTWPPWAPAAPQLRHRIPDDACRALAADPAVAALDRYQTIPFAFRGQQSSLATFDLAVTASRGHLALIQGGASSEVLGRVHRDGLADPGAVASESFARRFRLRVGDRVDLPGHPVTLRGVYADFGNERGSLILDRPVFLAWFRDDRAASLALYLKPGSDPAAVARRLARQWPGLQIRANAELRERVLRIFRQTFAITYALEVIGLVVALAGLAQSLAGLALARRGDIWTLRALGAGSRAVTAVLLGEGLGIALAGCAGRPGPGPAAFAHPGAGAQPPGVRLDPQLPPALGLPGRAGGRLPAAGGWHPAAHRTLGCAPGRGPPDRGGCRLNPFLAPLLGPGARCSRSAPRSRATPSSSPGTTAPTPNSPSNGGTSPATSGARTAGATATS